MDPNRQFSNVREQIATALETLGYNLAMEYPAGEVTLPRITYSQVANAYLTDSTDRIVYQIDAWANTFSEVLEMVAKIDEVMSSMRFKRTYESPDANARENIDLYHKALSYQVTADLLLRRYM